MTYTDAYIDYLTRFDYMDNPAVEEYIPSFLDSISDLETELDFDCEFVSELANNIIPFPITTWGPNDPAISAWAA